MITNCTQQTGSVQQSDDKWRQLLTADQYRVLRDKGTDPRNKTVAKVPSLPIPFITHSRQGGYDDLYDPGTYRCAGCNTTLYSSEMKFDCGCGWPGFWDCIPGTVCELPDADGHRSEIVCAACTCHLGHVFRNEGFQNPEPNERHCVNSTSLSFQPSTAAKPDLQPGATGSSKGGGKGNGKGDGKGGGRAYMQMQAECAVAALSLNSIGLEWYSIDDVVMGGQSNSTIELSSAGLRFSGCLSNVGGGFCTMRTRDAPLGITPDSQGLNVRYTSDDFCYKITISCDTSTDTGNRGKVSWKYSLPRNTTREMVSVHAPFAGFVASASGRQVPGAVLDPTEVKSVGLQCSIFLTTEEGASVDPTAPVGDFELILHSLE